MFGGIRESGRNGKQTVELIEKRVKKILGKKKKNLRSQNKSPVVASITLYYASGVGYTTIYAYKHFTHDRMYV